MAIVTLFKHRKPVMRIVGKSLRVYQFTQGRYFTQIEAEEKELRSMIGQSGVYIDPKEPTIDTEAADPVSIMEKNMRQKLLEELRGQGVILPDSMSDKSTDMKNAVSTSSSTITGGQAAERVEEARIQERADQIMRDSQIPETAPKSAELSPLERLNAMKNQVAGTSQSQN